MAEWHDISSAPKDGREIIIGWKADERHPEAIMVLAAWFDVHYNGPGWYGEQRDDTWGDIAYDEPHVWTEAPELPA